VQLNFDKITQKWQNEWTKKGLGNAESIKGKKKFYLIFAYPGVSGFLHVGHMRGYTYADIITRFKRMQGYNVLFPAGFHASGLPAIAYSVKIKKKDPATINQLKEYGLNDKQIQELEDPKNTVEFFKRIYVEDFWKKFGFLIDYRRLISTIQPEYNKFMEWQFSKLKEANLLVQKPHFAPCCPNCGPVAIDTAETDIAQGGTAETINYTIIKFKLGKRILPAATLRPETVYGVINMWLNPETELVVVKYNNEEWILCKEAAEKLKFQKHNFEITSEKIPAKSLIGKKCINPVNNQEVLILPAGFVECGIGTGVVMSVPSHAPYDWIALNDLQQNPQKIEEYKISKDKLLKLKPVSLIKTPDFGEHPAIELCKSLGLKSQNETEKLEEATQIVYRKEFHSGKLNSLYGKNEGVKVSDAKDILIKEFEQKNVAEEMYGFSEKVVCRCGTEVIVKLIPNQWFIKYSDNELTSKSKEQAKKMSIWPDQYKKELPGILDWFNDRACVRQGSWLGTKFPFDRQWVIEPISDSTLYPLIYILSKYITEGKINSENLCNEFFDYIFLSEGTLDAVAKKTGLDKKLIRQVKNDFEYWYPLDLNLGGKEHKTVHFPVFLMNHVAVLKTKDLPKGIFVNWWVVGENGKISKSKGGAVSLHNLAKVFSVDALRLYYCHIGSAHIDIQFDEKIAQKYKSILQKDYLLIEKVVKSKKSVKRKIIDDWLVETLNQKMQKAINSIDGLNLKKFSQEIYYSIPEDLNWYLKRDGLNKKLLLSFLEQWTKLMMPITPHLAEEIWHTLLKKKTLVSTEQWKKINKKTKQEVIQTEILIKTILSDLENIKQLAKINKPKKITFFVAPAWKNEAIKTVVAACKDQPDFKKAMAGWMKNPKLKKHADKSPKMVKKIISDFWKMKQFKPIAEFEILNKEKKFFEKLYNTQIEVTTASKTKKELQTKASSAMPMKPAIYIE